MLIIQIETNEKTKQKKQAFLNSRRIIVFQLDYYSFIFKLVRFAFLILNLSHVLCIFGSCVLSYHVNISIFQQKHFLSIIIMQLVINNLIRIVKQKQLEML